MHTFTHGVGSSCGGEEYHHEVIHASRNKHTTLCGVSIKGRHWWESYDIAPHGWDTEAKFHIGSGESITCARCAKIMNKEQ